MKQFFKDFKDFLNRGSLLELATAVVMGGALKSVIDALVKNFIMPLINLISPSKSFNKWSYKFGNATFNYGSIIEALINFIVIGFVVFVLIRFMSKLKKKTDEEVVLTTSEKLLEEIRDLLENKKDDVKHVETKEMNEK